MNNRIFNIQGVDNFRHMGGYKTADGGITRDDRLYRCGHLFDLSEAGGKKIEALNINQVVDFRSEAEKEVRPAQWPNSWQPTYYPTPIGGNAAAWIKELFERIASGKFPRQDLHDQLIIAFRTIPIDNKDGLKRLFDVLIDGKADTATVFHCTAGKDRTGIGGALILRALGVHDDDILGDFMLTNEAVDLDAKMQMIADRIEAKSGVKIDPSDTMPLAGVSPDFLDNAWNVMANNYGSVSNYMTEALGLTEARIEILKARYLRG